MGFVLFAELILFFSSRSPPRLSSNIIVTFSRWASFCQLYLQGSAGLFFWFSFEGGVPIRVLLGSELPSEEVN